MNLSKPLGKGKKGIWTGNKPREDSDVKLSRNYGGKPALKMN